MDIPITTERLIIDKLKISDVGAIYKYRSDPDISKYQNWEPTEKEIQSFIQDLESQEIGMPGLWYQLGIFLKENDKLIGDLGIHVQKDDPRQAEVGITLSKKYQGRGFGAEAFNALLEFLFIQLDMHRVYGSVDPRNTPSMVLMQRVGMRQEAHLIESLWFKGYWADDVIFAMLEREYKKGR